MTIWEKKHGPTAMGKIGAVAKGVFLTGEPIVEHAEYLLRFNGHSPERRLQLYARVARSDVTDKLFDKMSNATDPEIQAILAKGFKRAFEKNVSNHEAEDTSIEAAGAMLAHWKERREYVHRVEDQAKALARKFWLGSPEALETISSVTGSCNELKKKGWMQPDERNDW
jgi:hypothetical protein